MERNKIEHIILALLSGVFLHLSVVLYKKEVEEEEEEAEENVSDCINYLNYFSTDFFHRNRYQTPEARSFWEVQMFWALEKKYISAVHTLVRKFIRPPSAYIHI